MLSKGCRYPWPYPFAEVLILVLMEYALEGGV